MPIPAAWLAVSPVVFGAAGIGGPGSAAWLAVQESKNALRQAHGIANRPCKARDQVHRHRVAAPPRRGGSLIAGALLALWTVSERPSGPAGPSAQPAQGRGRDEMAARSFGTTPPPLGKRRQAGRSPAEVAHRGATSGHARRDRPFAAPVHGP